MSSPLAGAEMMTFFAPACEVGLGFCCVGEQARALDDDFHPLVVPGDLGGVAVGEAPDGLAVDDEPVFPLGDGALEAPVVGVVLEEVGVGLDVE